MFGERGWITWVDEVHRRQVPLNRSEHQVRTLHNDKHGSEDSVGEGISGVSIM